MSRYPTLDEFWERLEARELEPDLRQALQARAGRTAGTVSRVGDERTVVAVVRTTLPGAAVPAEVLAAFIDANFDRQLGRGDERTGAMPRAELIPAGFRALDEAGGGAFHALDEPAQQELLARAERGELAGPEGFDSALWFNRVRGLLLLGFGSDPRGMVQMGFPGPSYRPGYTWLGWGGPAARAERKPGYRKL